MQNISSTYLAQKWIAFIREFFEEKSLFSKVDIKISARRGDIGLPMGKAILLLIKFVIKRAIILGHANF